ncbi:MAG: prepilin-type N-terminal cleavage/methylation domain-containing protein [Desulforhopalus sp.]|jgi:prepilin-type N-terminal cleavage/methylation domain-containing protein
MKGQQGFTLIELVVVIGVIGILLAVVTLNFSRLNEKYSMETEIKDLYSILMRTRDTARKINTPQLVTIAANAVQIGADANQDGAFDAGANITTVNMGRFTLAPVGNFTFDRRGLASVTQTIQITGTGAISPAMNCIDITGTRLNIGLMNGVNCDSK